MNKLKRIRLSELQEGDILLLLDVFHTFLHSPSDGKNHPIIFAGQAIAAHSSTKASSRITHAALYIGNGVIIEASGKSGLRKANLKEKLKGSEYHAYRYSRSHIIHQAVIIAKAYNARRERYPEFGNYDMLGAFLSIGRSSLDFDPPPPVRNQKFYCSNFVVRCFNRAAVKIGSRWTIFPFSPERVTPKKLHGFMREHQRDFICIGKWIVP